MEQRLLGTVSFLSPEKGFGLIKVPQHPKHHFRLTEAPNKISRLDLVTFRSEAEPGFLMPLAKDIKIITDATLAA